MALFDFLIMVDWSGGNGRKSNRANCIWIAHGAARSHAPTHLSPASRAEATDKIIGLLQPFAAGEQDGRALVCFDFPYGYPTGFANELPAAPATSAAPWQRVWHYLHHHIQDDIGTKPGGRFTNSSNRFEVANEINRLVSTVSNPGPFWCTFPARYPSVPQNQPAQPFLTATGASIRAFRLTEQHVQSDFPFRLFGNGSVGSQMLVGIPRLVQIRHAQNLAGVSAIWPFETGWAPAAGDWSLGKARILHAEIYPSVMPALPDSIPDRGQVRAMWEWARNLDAQGTLQARFARPASILASSPTDLSVCAEEGWILH